MVAGLVGAGLGAIGPSRFGDSLKRKSMPFIWLAFGGVAIFFLVGETARTWWLLKCGSRGTSSWSG